MSTLPKCVAGASLAAGVMAGEATYCNTPAMEEKLKNLGTNNKLHVHCKFSSPGYLKWDPEGEMGNAQLKKVEATQGKLAWASVQKLKYSRKIPAKESEGHPVHEADSEFKYSEQSDEQKKDSKTNFKPGFVAGGTSDSPKCEPVDGDLIKITGLTIAHGHDFGSEAATAMFECTAGHDREYVTTPPPPPLKKAAEAGYGKDKYAEGTFECSIDKDSGKFLALKSDKIVIKKDSDGKGKVDAWTSLKFGEAKVYSAPDSEATVEQIGAVNKINPGNSHPSDLDALGDAFQERKDEDKVYDLVLRGKTTNKLSLKKEFNDNPKEIEVEMTCKETKGKGGDPEKEKPKEKTCCEKYCCAITFGVIGGVVLIGGIAAYFLLANKGDDAGDEEEEEEDEEGEGDEE